MNFSLMKYQKYKIPPNFDLAQLHAKSCKLYKQVPDSELANLNNKCGCCNQFIGKNLVPMCEYVTSLRRIGEEVPLFFNFITLMILLCIFILFTKAGQILFYCSDCQNVNFIVQDLWGLKLNVLLGFMNPSNFDMMVQILLYSLVILIVKIHLKTKKYRYQTFNLSIQKRSVQLTNLPTDCTQRDIKTMLRQFHVQEVVFAYRVREYHKYMIKIAKLKKTLRYFQSSIQHDEDQKIKNVQQKLQRTKKHLQFILSGIKNKKKKLPIAFVVFQSINQKRKAFHKHHYNILNKIFYKICTCYSNNAINGQHVSIIPAPSPDDIKWQNLENNYYQIKFTRFLSFLVCSGMLLFGLVSQVIIFNKNNDYISSSGQLGQFFWSLVIFLINFLTINFLQFSTNSMESHQSNTRIKLSLIKKITFFMFFNVSISPFLIMFYNRTINSAPVQSIFNTISLTIIIVCVGNFFKPFLTLFSFPRFSKWYSSWRQKSKKNNSQLNQLQANQLFEPLQFPIQIFYSLIHASLMMSFFYLGCFQFLIIVELPSLLMLYFIAKWMLLRVCKQPRGISLKLNNLAQSLMRFYVPLYWLGRNIILVTKLPDDQLKILVILQKIIYEDIFQIISTSIVSFMLFCEFFVSKIAKVLVYKKKSELSQYFDHGLHNRTYSEANLFFKIHEQGLTKLSLRLSENKNNNNQSQQSIDLGKQILI